MRKTAENIVFWFVVGVLVSLSVSASAQIFGVLGGTFTVAAPGTDCLLLETGGTDCLLLETGGSDALLLQ